MTGNGNNKEEKEQGEEMNKKRKEKEEDPDSIYFKISEGEKECYYRVKRTTKIKKVLESYCERFELNISNTRFLYNGSRFPPNFNFNELCMQNGDVIDALSQVHGGAALTSHPSAFFISHLPLPHYELQSTDLYLLIRR